MPPRVIVQAEFLDAARALFQDRAPDDVYLRILTSLFKDFVDESGEETSRPRQDRLLRLRRVGQALQVPAGRRARRDREA